MAAFRQTSAGCVFQTLKLAGTAGKRTRQITLSQIYFYGQLLQITYLCDLEGLDLSRVFDVRTSTQIDEGAATIHRGGGGCHLLL